VVEDEEEYGLPLSVVDDDDDRACPNKNWGDDGEVRCEPHLLLVKASLSW
jgi:hypothetical protein